MLARNANGLCVVKDAKSGARFEYGVERKSEGLSAKSRLYTAKCRRRW